jgi:hypothetical protein
MAWVSASSPVSAVMRGGSPAVMAGSMMATVGTISRFPVENFRFSAVSVRTTAQVASLPVPLVVGMATSLLLAMLRSIIGLMSVGSRSGRS